MGAVVCCVLLAAALVARQPGDRESGRMDLFEPLTVFVVAFGLMFVVRPTVVSLDDLDRPWIAGDQG